MHVIEQQKIRHAVRRRSTQSELSEAFDLFSHMSAQLEDAYRELEERVTELSSELAQARADTQTELEEKKRFAAHLEALLSTLPGGVIVLDEKNRIMRFNPAAADLLGMPLQQLPWTAVARRAFNTDSIDGSELRLKDGRSVSIAKSNCLEDKGRILLLTDVTESRELSDLLSRHKRLAAMGQMSATLAHQVRTPLAAALLYCSQLGQPWIPEYEKKRFQGKILARLKHLEQMVEDMLRYSRGGSNDHEQISVTALCEEIEQHAEAHLANGACLLVEDDIANVWINGSRQELIGAMLNLVTNALHASEREACIVLAAHQTQDFVELTITDDGPGIREEIRDKVFDPFFTTRHDGTGLGLAVVRQVAHAHGGTVMMRFPRGGGSCIGIRLPIIAHENNKIAELREFVDSTAMNNPQEQMEPMYG